MTSIKPKFRGIPIVIRWRARSISSVSLRGLSQLPIETIIHHLSLLPVSEVNVSKCNEFRKLKDILRLACIFTF